jgi:hypothetical protein
VGDLVPRWEATVSRGNRAAAVVERKNVVLAALTPVMKLIEISVAPGSWNVPDGMGNLRSTATTKPNSMVAFFPSLSIIIRADANVHDQLAKFLRALREVRYGPDETPQDATSKAANAAGQTRNQPDSKPAPTSTADSSKRIGQLMDALREEVRKLEAALPGAEVRPVN